jgi:hypothetical protein
MSSPITTSQAAMNYLERIGATMKSLFNASIIVNSLGYEKDIYTIRFDRQGKVHTKPDMMPTEQEAEAIEREVSALQFPDQVTLSALPNSDLPPLIRDAATDDLYIFRDQSKNIVFIQVRVELDNGDKRYVPQTFWSDGVWRAAEPEEGLPIYNLDLAYKGARVFLHEGAKSARIAQRIADEGNHPWSEYFSSGVHLGWIGGAHHLHRTRWRDLNKIPGELLIVPDNDFISKFTVSKIAKRFMCPTYYTQFDARWPQAWDVADPMPKNFFADDTGLYQGPLFEELLQSCNWATEEVGQEGNRIIYAVREEFAQNWVRIQNLRHYANIHHPEITLDRDQFNIKVRPFSHVADTSALLAKVSGNICDKVTFMPNQPKGLISIDGELCLNQYIDRRMRPLVGGNYGTEAFWKFMEYLIPDDRERREVVRWMATLYARPSVRMGYGILLLSKMQGVGKSTLLDIMADLIGRRHVSFPGDAMVQSDFNGWVVNKRLVVVHEIYAGQNWKTYNRLKSLITDDFVEANNKHMVNYTLPNWSHYAAASNSMEALRIEHDDRRWLVPKLANTLYDDYQGLYDFITAGGLRSLAQDLLDFGHYVTAGEHAPLTASKVALIDQSMPMDERLILVVCQRLTSGYCLEVMDLWLWLQEEAKGRAYITPQRIISLLSEKGFAIDKPAELGGRQRQMVWKSPEDRAKTVGSETEPNLDKRIMAALTSPDTVFAGDATM